MVVHCLSFTEKKFSFLNPDEIAKMKEEEGKEPLNT